MLFDAASGAFSLHRMNGYGENFDAFFFRLVSQLSRKMARLEK
jgi:hypothetical protein